MLYRSSKRKIFSKNASRITVNLPLCVANNISLFLEQRKSTHNIETPKHIIILRRNRTHSVLNNFFSASFNSASFNLFQFVLQIKNEVHRIAVSYFSSSVSFPTFDIDVDAKVKNKFYWFIFFCLNEELFLSKKRK